MEKPSQDYFKTEEQLPIDKAVVDELIQEAEGYLFQAAGVNREPHRLVKAMGRALVRGLSYIGRSSGYGMPN